MIFHLKTSNIYTIIFILFFSSQIIAQHQTKKIDSLKYAIDTATIKQSVRIYWELGNLFRENNDSFLYYSKLGISTANKTSEKFGLSVHISSLGIYYENTNNLDSALYYYRNSLNIDAQKKDTTRIIGGLTNLYRIHRKKERLDSAKYYIIESIKIAEKSDKPMSLAGAKKALADYYYAERNYEKSINLYHEAIKIYQNIDTKKIYFFNSQWHLSTAYNMLGMVYKENGAMKKAKEYLELGVDIGRKYPSGKLIGIKIGNLANFHLDQGEYELAEKYFLESLEIFRKHNAKHEIAETWNNIGILEFHKKNYKKSLEYFYKAHDTWKEINIKQGLLTVYQNLVELNDTLGQYKTALDYQLKFQHLKDSIFTKEREQVLKDIELKYETEKKENENLRLKAKNEKQAKENLIQKSILTGTLIFTSFIGLLFFQSIKRNNKLKKQKEQIEKQKDKIDKLLTYVEHNTKNQLTQLVALINIQDRQLSDDSEAKQVLKASKGRLEAIKNLHLQLLKQPPGNNTIQLKPYLEATIQNIFSTFENDVSKKLNTETKIDDITLDMNTTGSIGLILNEIITNVFKHAINENDKNPTINIKASKKENNVLLKIFDNGPGFPIDFEDSVHQTFGMELIKALSANCGGNVSFSNNPGACYEINIPTN